MSDVDTFVTEKARMQWTERLKNAKDAAEDVLSGIRCGNTVDMRPLYRAFAIQRENSDGSQRWDHTSGGSSDYAMQKGMIEHLIFTLIQVRNSHAANMRDAQSSFRQDRYGESFQDRVIAETKKEMLEAMLKNVDDQPVERVTITGQNIDVKHRWEGEEE